MMHDEDGDVMLALQRAEVAEQRGDFSGVVLVDAVEAHEGIEHEKARRVAADRVAKARLIAPAIEAQDGHGTPAPSAEEYWPGWQTTQAVAFWRA